MCLLPKTMHDSYPVRSADIFSSTTSKVGSEGFKHGSGPHPQYNGKREITERHAETPQVRY